MGKRIALVLTLLFLGLWQIPEFRAQVISSANRVRGWLVTISREGYTYLLSYLNAASKVRELQRERLNLYLQINQLEAELSQLTPLRYFKSVWRPNLVFAETISYANLPSFTQVYIDYNRSVRKPKGLVYNNQAAGIVVKSFGDSSLALLNSDPKCSYTVYIGKGYVPGIFEGERKIIKYIPLFSKVSPGDLVITSGLDGIFYRGAQVGIIVEVERKKLYQEAKVKTFYDDLHPTYFFVVERVPPEDRNPITFEQSQSEGNMSGEGNRSDQNRTLQGVSDQNRTGG